METDSFQVRDRDLTEGDLNRYLSAPTLALDTETMGLIPQRDRLCLVQICDPQGFVTALRIELGQTSAPHLKHLLEQPNILKIFHFARRCKKEEQFSGVRKLGKRMGHRSGQKDHVAFL